MKHKVRHIHFVGIGGAGMSGIAEVFLNLGYRISGSDLSESAVTRRLAGLGATVYQGHAAAQIEGADCIVHSAAVRPDNLELVAGRSRRIPLVARAMMLAELMKLKQGIAVAGTHGKTTTTSLVASVLAAGGMDPTFVIGGRLNSAGVNGRLGTGEMIVVEADESDASFLNLSPSLAIITNIDAEHMETYGHDPARLRQAFVEFTHRLPFYGAAIVCIDDPGVRNILPFVSKPLLTYGTCEDAQIRATELRAEGASMHFRVLRESGSPLEVQLNLPGRHNVLNALAAIGVAEEHGLADEAVLRALREFKGVGRRFQRFGEMPARAGGCFTLIDDYGHHPVEMAAVLSAARGAFPGRRVLLAFQPHRYTRTRDLFEDFVAVLGTADLVLLSEVYAAGEAPIVAADGRSLARALRVAGRVEPIFCETLAQLEQAVIEQAQADDVVIAMGAGSIGTLAPAIRLSLLGERGDD